MQIDLNNLSLDEKTLPTYPLLYERVFERLPAIFLSKFPRKEKVNCHGKRNNFSKPNGKPTT